LLAPRGPLTISDKRVLRSQSGSMRGRARPERRRHLYVIGPASQRDSKIKDSGNIELCNASCDFVRVVFTYRALLRTTTDMPSSNQRVKSWQRPVDCRHGDRRFVRTGRKSAS
jgi:hypothetical protein